MSFSAVSHPGSVRDHNEDAHAIGGRLALIADGVGGHAAGEVASALTVEAFEGLTAAQEPVPDPVEVLRAAIVGANTAIAAAAKENEAYRGMGTTVVALLFSDEGAHVAHVGDSRAYRLRGGELARLTRDDSYVQMLIDKGALAESDVRTHPYRSVVLKALLGEPVEPTIGEVDVAAGDRYLLCSDGLSDVVSDEDIARALTEVDDGTDACEELTRLALEAGGPDNITIIIVDASLPSVLTRSRYSTNFPPPRQPKATVGIMRPRR
ncbi:PP2C family protein-serine/threonine phosphatase [Stackebrandtia soli]|uniref:PP2C family protein-serine/threonine phosphatase n=1 Tax=Stackebrandtia soli TaxID=1892856 RepID=UPI0039EB3765